MKKIFQSLLLFVFGFTLMVQGQILPPIKKFELSKPSALNEKKEVTSEAIKDGEAVPVKPAAPIQTPLPAGQKRVDSEVIEQEYFICPKDKKEFIKAGKCPAHGTVLEKRTKSFTYKCKQCGYASEKEGKCIFCKGAPALRKFEVTYRDVGCKVVESAPGKCPKCQQDLKKVVEVELKK